MFHVGQQVVCIGEDGQWLFWPYCGKCSDQNPMNGTILTIAEIVPARNDEPCWLAFVEYRDSDLYEAECFRPVRKTNTDIFTKLLSPTPTRKLEDV